MTTAPRSTAVHKQVVVDAPLERAFAVFTEDFGRFKPAEHNILGVELAEIARSRCASSPRSPIARGSSSSTATSSATPPVGRASAAELRPRAVGPSTSTGSLRCSRADHPTGCAASTAASANRRGSLVTTPSTPSPARRVIERWSLTVHA
jgi:hypothetical protein